MCKYYTLLHQCPLFIIYVLRQFNIGTRLIRELNTPENVRRCSIEYCHMSSEQKSKPKLARYIDAKPRIFLLGKTIR